MSNIKFINNSISGRDYRAKGVHIVIPGYSDVTINVPDKIADKVMADIRRTSPAIQAMLVRDPGPNQLDCQDDEDKEAVEATEIDEGDDKSEFPFPTRRQGRGRGKKTKKQYPSKARESEVSVVTVEEVTE